MKKKLVASFFAIFLIFSLSSPAFASDTGTGEEPGGGFTFETIGEFIKGLFIPDDDYFTNKTTELNNAFESKMGGLPYLISILSSFWDVVGSQTNSFVLSLPANFIAPGSSRFRLDFFDSSMPVSQMLPFVRGIANVFIVLLTAIVCYHKLRTLLAKDGAD